MASVEEYELTNTDNRRPPRNVLKGGLNRAKAAGQQLAGASRAGGASSSQIGSQMQPHMTAFMAEMGNQQKMQNITSTLTELRRQSAVDQMTDNESKFNSAMADATKTEWDDYIRKGAEVAMLVNAGAGLVANAGTDTVEGEQFVEDKDGNVMYDNSGKPITKTVKRETLSGAAKGARAIQDAIGKIIPSVGRSNKSARESRTSAIELANQQSAAHADALATNVLSVQAAREMKANQDNFTAQIEGLRETNAELGEALNSVIEANRMLEEKYGLGKGPVVQPAGQLPPGVHGPPAPSGRKYAPLLGLVSGGEGGPNSYNRGKAGDSVGKPAKEAFGKDFTEMTIGEVMELQSKGDVFAVGKYQFIPTTLAEMVKKGKIDKSAKFDEAMQERLGELIIEKKRPAVAEYVNADNPTSDQRYRAAKALAREWASVADPDTNKSFYHGIGGNEASITTEEIYKVLDDMRAGRY